jgi:ECF sigma factor
VPFGEKTDARKKIRLLPKETSRFQRGTLAGMTEVTRILSAIEQGEPHAAGQLLPLVYDELRRLAAQNSTWFDSFEQFQTAIDDCLNTMATDHKQAAATLFVHKFQRFEDVPILVT